MQILIIKIAQILDIERNKAPSGFETHVLRILLNQLWVDYLVRYFEAADL